MSRSKFGVSVSFALLATVVISSYSPQAQSREIGETPDFALRRAQAFHDMYAGTEERTVLQAAKRSFTLGQQVLLNGGGDHSRFTTQA
jgi:hypothetical protein